MVPDEILGALFEALPLGVTVTHFPGDGPEGAVLVAANSAANRLLRLDLTPFLGVSVDPSTVDDDYDQVESDALLRQSFDVAVGNIGPQAVTLELLHGPARGHYESVVFPIGDRRSASVFRRIDVEREAQLALDWAMESLEASNAHLLHFATTVAHDLKNPLAGIKGHVQLLQMMSGDLPEAARAGAERVVELTELSTSMIDGMLQVARAPASASASRLHLGQAVDWVERVLADQLDHPIIRPSHPDPELGEVIGHEAAVRQVLLNLVSNSLRYRRPGRPVEIAVRPVESPRPGEIVRLDVIDNGNGIADADRALVFEWGYRSSHAADASGSGIGLAASRAVMVNIGGDIWVGEPPPGGGTTMCLSFEAVPRTDTGVVTGSTDVRVIDQSDSDRSLSEF